MNNQRKKMKEQAPKERIKNFLEVPLGFTEEEAREEASRCLQCKGAPCRKGCPVEIDIPAFLDLIKEGKFVEAAWKIKETNSLPAICGRVCPQEELCEEQCVLRRKGQSIAIGALERFAADYERSKGEVRIPQLKKDTGFKVAVVGSGPSGLTCAGELKKFGHAVSIFEALHKSGGVLTYGIPEFRLPKSIVGAEINYIEKLGVGLRCNAIVGRLETVDDLLKNGFNAVYIATGAGAPMFMGIPGENLNFIYSANEFLTRMNLMEAYKFPKTDTPVVVGKHVAVIGGGNTAMDAARCSLRLGPEKVMLIYRRSHQEMPARKAEIHHAEEEGIEFMMLTAPVEYIGDKEGNLKRARCVKMRLGEPDSSGRKRPVVIPGSEFEIEIDSVVVAIGTQANPVIADTTKDLKVNYKGYIEADAEGRTSRPGVFAGGDIVSGSATVIEAMRAGRVAARSIDNYLRGLKK